MTVSSKNNIPAIREYINQYGDLNEGGGMKKKCDDRPTRQHLPCYSVADDTCYGDRLFSSDVDAKPKKRIAICFCRHSLAVDAYLKNKGESQW